jgi:putative NADH-flavin reductase
MRRILVLGSTGATGLHLLEQAAARDFQVTALVRSREKLQARGDALRIVLGDVVSDSTDVGAAYANQDAVVSALGVGRSFKSNGLIAQAAPRIVAAMREHGVRRLVFTSAFGVGPTWQDTPFVPRLFIKTMLRNIYADKAAGEQAIKNSSLDWTIVYPTGLTNGPRTGAVRVGERLRLTGFPTISRADVAAVLLDQINDPRFVRKGILVSL